MRTKNLKKEEIQNDEIEGLFYPLTIPAPTFMLLTRSKYPAETIALYLTYCNNSNWQTNDGKFLYDDDALNITAGRKEKINKYLVECGLLEISYEEESPGKWTQHVFIKYIWGC